MTITKAAWMRYTYTIVITIIIHTLCHLVFGDGRIEFFSLLGSIMLGVNVWFLAEVFFAFAQSIWTRNELPSYIVLLLAVGIGTSIGTYALGVSSWYLLAIICALAEIATFLLVFLYRSHYKKVLNTKLADFQKLNEQ
jgi:hypothetical protein